jgi:hypothetical protein
MKVKTMFFNFFEMEGALVPGSQKHFSMNYEIKVVFRSLNTLHHFTYTWMIKWCKSPNTKL